MKTAVRNYALVTGAYWGFTLTDGALRMLVLLHFDRLGYSAVADRFSLSLLRVLRNRHQSAWRMDRGALGIEGHSLWRPAASDRRVDNAGLSAAGVGSRHIGRVRDGGAGALGIAKDLTKMSAKSAIKVVVPEGEDGALFQWVARLTGSKNALKGLGFFMGGVAAGRVGFRRFADGDGGRALRRLDWNRRGAPKRSGKGQIESQIHHAIFQELGCELAFGGTPVSLLRARRLVRGRASRSSWLRLCTGRSGRWARSALRGSSVTASCRLSSRRFFVSSRCARGGYCRYGSPLGFRARRNPAGSGGRTSG